MRPVAELSADLRGVFSDIDDTLTHNGVVDLEAYAALLEARAGRLRVSRHRSSRRLGRGARIGVARRRGDRRERRQSRTSSAMAASSGSLLPR